jgi:decaprenyl-phosphate phosphoribosyltransferase
MKKASFFDYVKIARIDHWFKNIFVIPGILCAWAFGGEVTFGSAWIIIVGLFIVSLAASANYTINEWLDRDYDKFHPIKKNRPCVTLRFEPSLIYSQWVLLSAIGLVAGWFISYGFFISLATLIFMGIVYNVKPLRTKDRVYVDVLSESINNPLRFMLGWYLCDPSVVMPSSLLLAYWFGGAFLMGMKRFAEFRTIGDISIAGSYRRSFQFYNEKSLLVSSFLYAIMSTNLLGIFMTKNKEEYILLIPFVGILFAWYLVISLSDQSTAQTPEKLYKEKNFTIFILFLSVLAVLLFFVEVPLVSLLFR